MEIACICGNRLEVVTVRLDDHELTIAVKPCAACAEVRYEQGYDDAQLEEGLTHALHE